MNPLLSETHVALATKLAGQHALFSAIDAEAERLERAADQRANDAYAREVVLSLARSGAISAAVAHLAQTAEASQSNAASAASPQLDSRALCVAREEIAYFSGLADTLLAMQGLGSFPIALSGSSESRAYLPKILSGEWISAFAITEEGAGSDIAQIATRAVKEGGDYLISGKKTLISNAGLADLYVVFARTSEAARGLSAFVVLGNSPGLDGSQRLPMSSPHPIGELYFDRVRVPASALLGAEGDGQRIALSTLDRYRPSVGAAAVGFARRAFHEALARAKTRQQFGRALADFQLTQARLAEMATELEAARSLVLRAAYDADLAPHARHTVSAAMAKWYATEAAQRIVDGAVQLFGGLGVLRTSVVERLYREVRALRIYEGTTEIQKLVIARELLRENEMATAR